MSQTYIAIEVDKVTTGKQNIVAFIRNSKQINTPPLILKPFSIRSEYNYKHHFDIDDLTVLNKSFPTIFPNEGEMGKEEWNKYIQNEFKELIKSGQFDSEYIQDGKTVSVKYIWVE